MSRRPIHKASDDTDGTRSVTIRLPARVVAHFKSGGAGYQTRIRQALEQHIRRQQRLESFDRACRKLKRLSLRDRKALALLDERPLNREALQDPFDALSD